MRSISNLSKGTQWLILLVIVAVISLLGHVLLGSSPDATTDHCSADWDRLKDVGVHQFETRDQFISACHDNDKFIEQLGQTSHDH